jgi:hypothetical protein
VHNAGRSCRHAAHRCAGHAALAEKRIDQRPADTRIGIDAKVAKPSPTASIKSIPIITTNAMENGTYAEVRKAANMR